jgi:hypothetical protein
MTLSYMNQPAMAADAVRRIAERTPYTPGEIRGVLARMVLAGGTAQIGNQPDATRRILHAALLVGLVCCDHSSAVWRLTDLGHVAARPAPAVTCARCEYLIDRDPEAGTGTCAACGFSFAWPA